MSNMLRQLSPRFSASYLLTTGVYLNFNTGRYYQLPAYTTLGYKDENGALVNYGTESQLTAIRSITLQSNASIGNDGSRFDIGRNIITSYGILGNGYILSKVGSNEISILSNSSNIGSVAILEGCLIQEMAYALAGAPVSIDTGGILSSYNNLTLTNPITFRGGSIRSSINS